MCYYSKQDILNRGWSAGMVEDLLPAPYVMVNMADRRQKTKIWDAKIVNGVEKEKSWKNRKKKI